LRRKIIADEFRECQQERVQSLLMVGLTDVVITLAPAQRARSTLYLLQTVWTFTGKPGMHVRIGAAARRVMLDTRCAAAIRNRMRITLVHALKHSIAPIEASFARLWPDARLMNLLDDSLSADLARDGRLTEAMTGRFLSIGRYAASTDADAILFTCSAFGPCIEAVAREHAPMPVLKPNAAMIEQAAARGRKIGLLSTFAPTLASMPPEFPRSIEIVPKLAAGALAALDRGDRAEHDRLVAEASRELRGCDLIALAQYSMAPAAALVAEASGLPVLTTPDSAVLKLKELLAVAG
jgi:Asp/Glu/hydantoin racemase